ncbi:MAG: AAA family ATPase [Bacteroidetes bacterium]|nr:AAA family ATPase [Bacteroidota bacterium]
MNDIEKNKSVVELVEKLNESIKKIKAEISKVIIGQEDIIDQLLISLLAKGHCLLVGVPGLAKTLLIKTLAQVIDLKFSRIQFTPDLMPSDIIGTELVEEDPVTKKRHFRFIPGPIFANIILADEINRTPPKTQAALLEAMQEHRVTTAGITSTLEEPFFVLATQNPIEQEGTYRLPEAQLDRFMFNLWLDYPSFEEEIKIVEDGLRDHDQNAFCCCRARYFNERHQVHSLIFRFVKQLFDPALIVSNMPQCFEVLKQTTNHPGHRRNGFEHNGTMAVAFLEK